MQGTHSAAAACKVLIVGAGDIARRVVPELLGRNRVYVVARRRDQAETFAGLGATPVMADLDDPDSLKGLTGLADAVLHLAPPSAEGSTDTRTRHLISAFDASMLAQGAAATCEGETGAGAELGSPRRVARLVYVSTSGVYGDCRGEWVDESRAPNPASPRARRRIDAEEALQAWGRRAGAAVIVLRAPGIYGTERLPLERLRLGTPVLAADDDVFTNHIHADDLAAACVRALDPGAPPGIYNASDDTVLKMGDWFDQVADVFGLPRPPRVRRAAAAATLPPALYSFMTESRRLVNRRMKEELGVILRYPTVRDGLSAAVRVLRGSLP